MKNGQKKVNAEQLQVMNILMTYDTLLNLSFRVFIVPLQFGEFIFISCFFYLAYI